MWVERKQQDAVATLILQRLQAFCDWRLAIAHGPIDDEFRVVQMYRQFLRLGAREGLERRFIVFAVPDFCVGMTAALRPKRQNDEIENKPPHDPVHFDDAAVGEELFQVAAHGPIGGGFRGSEIGEKQADFSRLEGRVAGWQGGEIGVGHDRPT